MMFWKRWFGYESLKLDSAPMWPVDVGKPVISKLKMEIISLKSQLEYQTDLAKSFRDRVHELEQQLTHKTELADAHKAAYEREKSTVALVSEDREEISDAYSRLLQKVSDAINYEYGLDNDDEPETDEPADSVGEETESDADSHLPTLSSLAGIGLASNDGEETQVFDSRQYGEQ